MTEKTGRPMRPENCLSLKGKEKKKSYKKHPNSHITKQNKTKRQNKELCSKERNCSMTHPPYMTDKVAFTTVAFMQWSKRNQISL